MRLLWAFSVFAVMASAETLEERLADSVKRNQLPGMAAMVFSKDAIVAIGVSGVRELGRPEPLTASDLFHIGSNAKAMLATAAAALVEEGKLSWNSKAVGILRLESAHRDYSGVTLADLLNHHAGLPEFAEESSAEWRKWLGAPPSTEPVTKRFAAWVLGQPPAVTPKSRTLYSNAGYAIAAAMIEQVSGNPWTGVLEQRVFAPLQISAVFTMPASQPNQPAGHYETAKGYRAQPKDETIDDFLRPAGDVSLSLAAYAKFLQVHLKGLQREDTPLLKAASISALHAPVDRMTFGWKIGDFLNEPASFHTGSAGTFYAFTTLVPSKNLGVVVFVNAGGKRAEQAALRLTQHLLADHMGFTDARR